MERSQAVQGALELKIRSTLASLRERYRAGELVRVERFVRTLIGGDGAEPADPLQRPVLYHFPGLTSRPWHESPAWMNQLEAAFPVIRSELDGLRMARAQFVPYVHGADATYRAEKFQLETLSDNWTVYDLLDPAAAAPCPGTTRLLGEIFRPHLGEPVTAQFSALRPGARIAPHCGVANFFLTTHLGLVHSERCHIRVGSEIRGWTEGKGIVFDDSFEHEVWHEGTETRIVLLARYWHPEMSEAEIESVGALHEALIDVAGTSEEAQRDALTRLRGGEPGAVPES